MPGSHALFRTAGAVFIAALVIAAAVALTATLAHATTSAGEKAQTVVHLLDYVSVDYPEFVRGGKVLDAAEYEEQKEFVTQAIALLEQLPGSPDAPKLLDTARQLLAQVDAKASGSTVSALANGLRADVIRAYRLTVAPRQPPDLKRAAMLYATQCVSCHGADGRGDGPLAKSMNPAPQDFHDEGRMSARSTYGLFNTIALGVTGTTMRGFAELSEADRWALAFYVGTLRVSPEQRARGEALWKQGLGRDRFASFAGLVTVAPGGIDGDRAADLVAVQAYLTAHPAALQAAAQTPLATARAKLDLSEQAYRNGDREAARQLAIGAYLEGFELVEASLDNVDRPLRMEVERAMMTLRAAIGDGRPVEVVAQLFTAVDKLLDRAQERLSAGNLSPAGAFVSALLILLREGLEAILVLAAILAFVNKTGRRDALPYIHVGWITAVALGALTWVAASHLLTISGANREVTEGAAALLAAAMLLYVGYWLHSKSHADAWQSFIRKQVKAALDRRTLWAFAGISFLAVFRELFEIILFYETLWVQVGDGGRTAFFGGIVAAALLLAATGWAILKYSMRLPIGPFFAAMSALLGIMAIVFAGNGIAALQEAGIVDATPVAIVAIPALGLHATSQGLATQLAVLALVVIGVVVSRRKAIVAAPAR